jgi:hypothetical protein
MVIGGTCSRHEKFNGFCEYNSEPSRYIKEGTFVGQLSMNFSRIYKVDNTKCTVMVG